MIKVRFEDLVINSLIILKEKYNISSVTSSQLENYKKTIFKNLKNMDNIINIEEEQDYYIKRKYKDYIEVDNVYKNFYKYKLKSNITLEKLKSINKIKYNNKLNDKEAVDSLLKCVYYSENKYKSYKDYNKLIRNNIPHMLKDKNEVINYVLNSEDYKKELYNNLKQIYDEFMLADEIEEKTEKGADMVEILSAIIELDCKDKNKLLKKVNEKKKTDGSFDKRLFLERIYTEIN